MSDASEVLRKVEYKVRPITRYVVTRFEEGYDSKIEVGPKSWSGSTVKGTYDSEDVAHEVGYALCSAEHDRLGWPEADARIQYPRRAGKVKPADDDLVISISVDKDGVRDSLREVTEMIAEEADKWSAAIKYGLADLMALRGSAPHSA